MTAVRNACGIPGPGERLIDPASIDAADLQLLGLIRVVCGVMDRRGAVPTEMVVEAAEALVPGPGASVLACIVVRLVRAAALGRAERLAYSNPACPACARVLTDPERHLLDVVRHGREGRRALALLSAALLCDRGAPGAVADAGLDVATVMGLRQATEGRP